MSKRRNLTRKIRELQKFTNDLGWVAKYDSKLSFLFLLDFG